MRAALAAVLSVFTVPILTSPGSSVRAEGRQVKMLVERGLSGSASFRALAYRLDASDVLVYVRFGRCSKSMAACLQFVSATADRRVLLVRVDPFDRPGHELIGLLAHELEHSLEIAQDASVRDTAAFERLFRQRGWPSSGGFETEHAQAIQRMVVAEILSAEERK